MQKAERNRLNKAKTKKPGNARAINPKPQTYRFRGQSKDYASKLTSLSPDGLDWLIAAIDPFHDFQRQIAGYPDVEGSSSVVSCTTTQFDLAAPGAVAWDCNIFTLPNMASGTTRRNYYADSSSGYLTQTAMTAPIELGPVNAISANAGQVLFPTTPAWNPVGMAYKAHALGHDVLGAVSRVVGWGIEVINTSPEINKSGMLTVYKVPQRHCISSVRVKDVTVGNICDGNSVMDHLCSPPSTAAEAAILPHSASWEAKEGAYVPVSMSGITNQAKNYEFMMVGFSDQKYEGVNSHQEWGTPIVGAAATIPPMLPQVKTVPYDTVGVFLTNLDPKSTFTVKVKTYVEKFPGTTDSVLLPICTPSPHYDAAALTLYAELLNELPVGTMSDNNANGDWFRSVLKVVSSIGVPIASLFGVRGAAQGVFGVADNAIRGLGKIFPRMP